MPIWFVDDAVDILEDDGILKPTKDDWIKFLFQKSDL